MMIDSIVNTQQVSTTHSFKSLCWTSFTSFRQLNKKNKIKKIKNKYYVCISSNFSNLLNNRYSDSAKNRLNTRYPVKNLPRYTPSRQTDTQIGRSTDRHTQTCRQKDTDREKDSQKDKQTGKQTDR